MRLKRFKKGENNNKNVIKIFGAFIVVAILLAGISYAKYETENEVLFINARVGEFNESDLQGDINLAMYLDGEEVDLPPEKGNYIVTVDCDYATGTWDETEWGANIRNISASRVKCNVNFATPSPTLSEVTATSTKTSIELSYTEEGVVTNTTCRYGTEEGSYSNNVDNVSNTNCNIKELEMDKIYYYQVCAKNGGAEVCKEGSIQTRPLIDIGDYISMTPTLTSYTIPTSITGYTSNQTINPSELNLWRVIRKNDDGTIDVVSEYVSSKIVYFKGKAGYINLVGGLNTIAAAYTNEKYVQSTRHIGYSNQTETLTDTAALGQTTTPWSKSTSLYNQWTGCYTSSYLCGTYESKGAGDIGYETDYNLVNNVYGNMIGKNPSGTATEYWLASRIYFYHSPTSRSFGYRYSGTDGILSRHNLYAYGNVNGIGLTFYEAVPSYSVRPILTLKAGVKISSGNGKSADTAYRFE